MIRNLPPELSSEKVLRLILVRHGETDYNVEKRHQGWLPSRLTANGRSQAFSVGLVLRDEAVDQIYCSDLVRTKETVEEIIKIINAPVKYVE